MKFPSPVPVKWLAEFLHADLIGNDNGAATGINEIHKVEEGDIVFVDHPKYYQKCLQSQATFVIINSVVECPPGKALLVLSEPFEAYLKIVAHFRPFQPAVSMISETATIGKSSFIYPGAFIGHHVTIGEGCKIFPGVSILDYCEVGNNVTIQANTVVGSDAFYYNTRKNRENWYRKMESCGRVLIGNDVEVGASCTIDRGVTHDTIIGQGTKLDNMVHIGHDTVIGKNCLIAAQVGIAGAVTLQDGVVLWGQVGVSKTLTIGENAVVLAQSGVPGDLEGGKIYWGSPTEDATVKKRQLVYLKRLPEIWDKVRNM